MRVTFRLKVVLLFATALLSLALMIIGSEVIAAKLRSELKDVEARLVPRVELALKLDAAFVDLTRSFQDAVTAQDLDALTLAKKEQAGILEMVEKAGPALEPTDAATLRFALEDYFSTADHVSRMLIGGEVGERALSAIADMQGKQKIAEKVIHDSTQVGRGEINRAFGSLHGASMRSSRFRMITAVVSVLVMFALWLWATRQLLQSLGSVSAGLNKFATGNFEEPILVDTRDELGDLARDANAMAQNLQLLADERSRADWLKSAQMELSLALSGNQKPTEVAARALKYLVSRTNAVAAALYWKHEDGSLRRLGSYADYRTGEEQEVLEDSGESFGPGEGILGQVAVEGELRVIDDVPDGYFPLVTALGRSSPRMIVLSPLKSAKETIAVVELAFFEEFTGRSREYLEAIEDAFAVALLAARARANVDRLLEETREQADRLAQQEEELRMNNQELSSQQEELRLANVELEQQQAALTERNVALDRARAREQEKAEELARVSLYKSQFLANMSHELRTPLNSMLLLSHLLAENTSKNLTSKQVEHCATIHSAGQELLELINQVLDLAKIEAGKQKVEIAEVPLVPLVESMQRMFEPLATNKNLSFRVDLKPDAPHLIYTDRSRLERILINLLSNAVKFTEVGHVALRVERAAANVTFETDDLKAEEAVAFVVEDTGIGIAKSELSRVFSPFEQVEATSARRYEGTGLGLAIARESATLLGGELRAESEPGKGSTFTCYLPRGTEAQVAAPRSERRRTTDGHKLSSSAPPNSRHSTSGVILVIEDDALLAEQLGEVIRDRGFEAMVATSGEEGLRLAETENPRGIVLDVKLPDIDGWTVMERLQSSPTTRDIPVHFLSALDAAENGLNRGAIGYLTKPASREQLRELIETLAVVHGASGNKILVVEDSVAEGHSIVALLEEEDFEATHVTSAEEALTALRRDTYGCIVLDLGLKEMDGLEFLEELRKQPDFSGTGVVIHTGRALTHAETRRLQGYAQAIVMKDGSSSERLLEEIRLFIHHVREGAPASVHGSESSSVSFDGTRLLLAEDDMRTVYSLSALLQSRGFEVLVAENGVDALALLDKQPDISCVLMDIMMPEMDGYEAMGRLRADPRFQKLPIIALTAKAMAGERERCIAAGASDYLSKPVDSNRLFSALERWTLSQGSADAS